MTLRALWPRPPRRRILTPTLKGHPMTDITIAKGAEALEHAIRFALANESTMNRDIAQALEDGHFAEPWPIGQTIGPVKPRENPSGMIIQHGQTLATWGDIDRVDMTFSISKSYLALLAGIAVDDGLIPDIHAPIRDLVDDGGFGSPQNRAITWAQMLQLTSEWEGTLWDKPDWIDHNRDVGSGAGVAGEKGVKRQMQPPGTNWEYNDVRVNRLSLALMRVFGRPLPEVLKERVMDPIGASDTWEWHGYDNSWMEIGGRRMQSVSGGRALGRWHLDQHPRSRSRRAADVAGWGVGAAAGHLRQLDAGVPDVLSDQSRLWVFVVAEQARRDGTRRVERGGVCDWRRDECDLGGADAGDGCCGAVAGQGGVGWVCGEGFG